MKQRLTEQQVQKLKDRFMGKRISFETDSGEKWTGTCQFLGYNPYLPSWEFQITVDRTPCSHVNPDTIKLVEQRKPIFK
jgi:hypothetical protein